MKSKAKKSAETDTEHRYRRVLMKVALVTQCRTSYDICIEALGIRNADELIAKAKQYGITLP